MSKVEMTCKLCGGTGYKDTEAITGSLKPATSSDLFYERCKGQGVFVFNEDEWTMEYIHIPFSLNRSKRHGCFR